MASIAAASVRNVMTISERAARSAAVRATTTPAASSARAFSRVRFHAATSCPRPSNRPATAEPMRPVPAIPIFNGASRFVERTYDKSGNEEHRGQTTCAPLRNKWSVPIRPFGRPLMNRSFARRRFLKFLSGSPLLAVPGFAAWAAEAPSRYPDPIVWAPFNPQEFIASPKDAINVFDFEPVARKNVPPAHFGYMASGIDDEVTLRANREGFLKFQLRPRRLNDVSKVDTSVEILGTRLDSPIIIPPTWGNKFFHPEAQTPL